MRVLAGDVGGTKTLLAMYERTGRGWLEVARARFASADETGLDGPARAFVSAHGGSVAAAAFGVAGPVEDGRSQTTNIPWRIDARSIADALGARTALVNDFEAAALGLLELTEEQVVVLQEGRVSSTGPIALLGAGTGLGEAIVVRAPAGTVVLPTEGGHTDFAPRDELEDALLRWLRRTCPDHVSYERVVSGLGLASIHTFLLESGLARSRPETLERLEREDPGSVIGEAGARGEDEACARALAIFVSLYGAEAGNLALKTLPTGGLFVGGGIAPKIVDVLRRGPFLESFLAKGRMRRVLEDIRVSVVMEPEVGLHGARAIAASLA
jgi:glucokinase